MISYLTEKIKYVFSPSYRNKVNERKNVTNERKDVINQLKDPCKLEKLLLTPLSEFEKKFNIIEERDDLGLYPAKGG